MSHGAYHEGIKFEAAGPRRVLQGDELHVKQFGKKVRLLIAPGNGGLLAHVKGAVPLPERRRA